MEFPITIDLKRPIETGDGALRQLVFDEPDLGLCIKVEETKSANDQTLTLLAGMAGVPVEVFLRMKEGDFRAVTRGVLDPYLKLQDQRAQEDSLGNGAAAT